MRGGMMNAQHMVPHAPPGAAGISVAPGRSLIGFGHEDFRRFGPRNGFFLGSPLWWDEGWGPSNSPQIVFVQPNPNAEAPAPAMHWEDAPKPGEPLMIELQGDRYVRISGQAAAGANSAAAADQPRTLAETHAVGAPAPPAELVPAVFVFRDGHREESSDYSIIAGVIYARGDYWSQGSWTRQIALTELDLPRTLQANQQRGVHFVLPSAPNEVVTRP
jgi:hypothetical protein